MAELTLRLEKGKAELKTKNGVHGVLSKRFQTLRPMIAEIIGTLTATTTTFEAFRDDRRARLLSVDNPDKWTQLDFVFFIQDMGLLFYHDSLIELGYSCNVGCMLTAGDLAEVESGPIKAIEAITGAKMNVPVVKMKYGERELLLAATLQVIGSKSLLSKSLGCDVATKANVKQWSVKQVVEHFLKRQLPSFALACQAEAIMGLVLIRMDSPKVIGIDVLPEVVRWRQEIKLLKDGMGETNSAVAASPAGVEAYMPVEVEAQIITAIEAIKIEQANKFEFKMDQVESPPAGQVEEAAAEAAVINDADKIWSQNDQNQPPESAVVPGASAPAPERSGAKVLEEAWGAEQKAVQPGYVGAFNEDMAEVPDHYLCPITAEAMVDPVVAQDGFTYERAAIEMWFSTGKSTSPLTNEDMETTLTPNLVLRNLIRDA